MSSLLSLVTGVTNVLVPKVLSESTSYLYRRANSTKDPVSEDDGLKSRDDIYLNAEINAEKEEEQAKTDKKDLIACIDLIGKLAIASTVVFTCMKNLSPSTAVKTVLQYVQSNPLQACAYSYLLQTYVPPEVAYMTIGGWMCLQSVTTLMTAVAQNNRLSMAYAASGYLLGKFIIDLPMTHNNLKLHPSFVIEVASEEIYDLFSSLYERYKLTQPTTE